MTPVEIVRLLLELAPRRAGAREVAASLAPHALSVGTERPTWIDRHRLAQEWYLTFGGEVIGVQLWDDRRGWATYARVYLARTRLADLESVVGPTEWDPGPVDAIGGPETAAATPKVGDHQVRVFIEHRAGVVSALELDLGKPLRPS